MAIENLHQYACKRFINVPTKTFDMGVLDYCCRCPVYIWTAKIALKYWIKILKMTNDRYVQKWY